MFNEFEINCGSIKLFDAPPERYKISFFLIFDPKQSLIDKAIPS